MKQKPHVIVFIPAYNEEKTIGKILDDINNRYIEKQNAGFQLEVIVVDDGSRDNTSAVARSKGVKRVTRNPQNRGLGYATRAGMQAAYEMGADIAVKIDADFQHDPKDIEAVIRPILHDEADVVFGSRFLGEITYDMPFYRKVGNNFFSFVTSLFTGLRVTDGQTGIMAFSRRYLAIFEMFSDYNETQQLIIDSWRKKMRVIEVPVLFHKREHGTSFISIRYPFKVIPNLVRLYVHTFPLKIFLPIGASLILLALIMTHAVITGRIWWLGDASLIILFLSGLQVILFGLVADVMSKR